MWWGLTLALLAVVAGAALWNNLLHDGGAYLLRGAGPYTATELNAQSFTMAPELLDGVYRAFSATSEDAIYDALAEVAAGGALSALYLERRGAMAENGLDQATQQIHSMEILQLLPRRDGSTLLWDTKWRVVGTVGDATHIHARGNTYSANLTIQPSNGHWKVTGFVLKDVDRSDAGTIVAAPQ
jgi:hypothetical protein